MRAQNGPEVGNHVCDSAHWSFSGAVVFLACEQLLRRRALLSNEVALQGRVMDILACVLRPATDTSVASLVETTDWVLVDLGVQQAGTFDTDGCESATSISRREYRVEP